MKRVVLITGFAAFGGETVNPSAEIAGRLDDWEARPGVRVVTEILPVNWSRAGEAVEAGITALSADLVGMVMLGQSGGSPAVTLERVAVNLASGTDDAGEVRADEPVIAGAPQAYFTTLPVKAIIDRLTAAGLPACASNSAGTYLCNYVYYRVLHRLAQTPVRPESPSAPVPAAGFIHLPYLPPQAAGKKPVPPSMAARDMEEAIREIVRVIIGGPAGTAGR